MDADVGSVQVLLRALRVAEGPSGVIAALWTWLDARRDTLGALRRTVHQIREEAREAKEGTPTLAEAARDEIAALEHEIHAADDDTAVAAAARTLAVIGCVVERSDVPTWLSGLVPVPGVDGAEVLVFRRTGWAAATGEGLGDMPPEANEQPSLVALAPALQVVPVKRDGLVVHARAREAAAVDNGVGREWDRWEQQWTRRRNEIVSGHGDPRIRVVAATLGSWGGPVWQGAAENPQVSPGNVIAAAPDDAGTADGAARAVAAVEQARRLRADVLVLPELSASSATVVSLRGALAGTTDTGPMATVVGLLHQRVEAAGDGQNPAASSFVNEALVLGPTGVELHRHRKLSAASFEGRTEDIRVGSSIGVVGTPAGGFAVVICLDVFAQHAKARIQQLPAQLLLVPSLSPKVSPHRSAATEAAHALWGLVVVCNRWFSDADGDAFSGPMRRSFAARAFDGIRDLSDSGEGHFLHPAEA